MKRLLTILFAFASLTAAAQYVPGQKNYGNYNIYGSQWINGDLKLQKCIRSKSDTLIIFTTAAGVVDTVNWRYLYDLVAGGGYFVKLGGVITTSDSSDTISAYTLNINDEYTFPRSDGSSGQTLVTDGSGVVTWGDASGGSSYWDSTSNVIHPTDTTNAVAIGTNSAPAGTMLRVNDGSVLFEGSTGTTPVSGAGTRMMWIPSKAAFRAGIVTGTQWDDALVGIWSYAFGRNSTASGHVSFCVGENCTTIGRGAFAGGNNASAPGEFSMSFGNGTQTPGQYSVAFNNHTISSGAWSFACGVLTVASGSQAFSSGWKSVATGISSFAIGDSSIAIGKASFAGGRGKAYGAYSFAFGDSINAQAAHSAAFGFGNLVRGNKNAWVATDDLFVLGNGYAAKNNALTVLKNGTAYIGDASSTTDPILTVSTTDSTTTLIGILKLTPQDDPPVSASEGMIYADTDHHLYYYNGTAWVQLD